MLQVCPESGYGRFASDFSSLASLLDAGADPGIVLTNHRALLSVEALVALLRRRPRVIIRRTLEIMVRKASRSSHGRQRLIHMAGKLMSIFRMSPLDDIRPFPITMNEYATLACAFGKNRLPKCPVRVGTKYIVTREFSVFYEWHMSVWCGLGNHSPVSYVSPSSVLVRQFATAAVVTALEAAGRLASFPFELRDLVVRILVEMP